MHLRRHDDLGIPRTAPGTLAAGWAGHGREVPRAQSADAPVSQVEAYFRQQYDTKAPPTPMYAERMEDVRALLASEPMPWSTGGFESHQHPDQYRRVRKISRTKKPSGRQNGQVKGRGVKHRDGQRQIRPERPSSQPRKKSTPEQEGLDPLNPCDSPHVKERPAWPPWLRFDEEHTEGGVHLNMAPRLAERIRTLQTRMQLQSEHQGDQGDRMNKSEFFRDVYVWVIVECCRDCATHDASLRHDETAYQSRFQKLKELVLQRFPQGVQVELLVEPTKEDKTTQEREENGTIIDSVIPQALQAEKGEKERDTKGPLEPAYRIGSFEVYMCCEDPLKPWGATSLRRSENLQSLQGLCISSKLKSRAWPSMDAVMKKISMSMPEVPVQVTVQNELEFPLPGVCVRVFSDEAQLCWGITDQAGSLSLSVPLFSPVDFRAERAKFMESKEKAVEVLAPNTHLTFTTETAVQFWQLETANELIVFCRDPRMDLEEAVLPIPDLVPFQGNLEYNNGETVWADEFGFIKSSLLSRKRHA